MAACSSGVARPAVSSITETRYCILDHLLWFGGAPRGRPLTPATNSSPPIRHRLADFFQGLSGTPVVSVRARRFRGDCAAALGQAAKVTDGADLSRTAIR